MAHTKAQGAVKGNRDSRAKRRGVKLYGGQKALAGNIIVRQAGSTFHAGKGVSTGKDYTLFAVESGKVHFTKRQGKQVVEIIHG